MATLKPFVKCACSVISLTGLFLVFSVPRAEAQQVSVTAVEATIVPQPDGTGQATFKIKATNKEQSTATSFFVVFADGTTAALNDIPAGGSATSDPQTKFIDLSNSPSASIMVPVTLQFSLDGEPVEMKFSVNVNVQ